MSERIVCAVCGANANVHVTEQGGGSSHLCEAHAAEFIVESRRNLENASPETRAAIADELRPTIEQMRKLIQYVETHGGYPPPGAMDDNPLASSLDADFQSLVSPEIFVALLRHSITFFDEHGRLPNSDEAPSTIGQTLVDRQCAQFRELLAYIEAHDVVSDAAALPGNPYAANFDPSVATASEVAGYLREAIASLERHLGRRDESGDSPAE